MHRLKSRLKSKLKFRLKSRLKVRMKCKGLKWEVGGGRCAFGCGCGWLLMAASLLVFISVVAE
jgi:hypothetical protein